MRPWPHVRSKSGTTSFGSELFGVDKFMSNLSLEEIRPNNYVRGQIWLDLAKSGEWFHFKFVFDLKSVAKFGLGIRIWSKCEFI